MSEYGGRPQTARPSFAGVAFLLFSAAVHAAAPPAVVKKSRSGICHDSKSFSYAATKNFESFKTLEECLQSGGRLPANRPSSVIQNVDGPSAVSANRDESFRRTVEMALVGAGLGILGAAGAWYWRRRQPTVNKAEELERRRWEGHRLEPREEDIFKRRHHRWDPWLKRIGYFDKNKKKK